MTVSTDSAPRKTYPLKLVDDSLPLFIYGTLMSSGRLHSLMKGCSLVSTQAVTPGGFSLVDLGSFPGLVQRPALTSRVQGEIYQVSPQRLITLDEIESEGWLYNRSEIEFLDKQGTHGLNGEPVTILAQVYLLHPQIAKDWTPAIIERGVQKSPFIKRDDNTNTLRWIPYDLN